MQMLKDKLQFKQENQRNWEKNTEFWLSHALRHVEDTKVFFDQKLVELINPNSTIVDMGCGNAWLLDRLLHLDIQFTYLGLDFNIKFIEYLKKKYSNLSNVNFRYFDLEENISNDLFDNANVVFNNFNFFEIPDLPAAFTNAVKMLKLQGRLVIFTIDCTYLILAHSANMKEFKDNLTLYEEMKLQGEVPFFFQNIDLGESDSKDLKYASVLYSVNDYFEHSQRHNMRMMDYCEIIKTSKFHPKIYQYMVFEKIK